MKWLPRHSESSPQSGSGGGEGSSDSRRVRARNRTDHEKGDEAEDSKMDVSENNSRRRPERRGGRGPPRGGGRERRREPAAGDKKISVKDDNLKKLLEIMCKQLTNNTMRVRQLMAMNVTTFLLPTDGAIVKAMTEEGESFAQTVREIRAKKKEGQEIAALGPPTLGLFLVLLQTLTALEIGGENKKKILAVMEDYGKAEEAPEELLHIGMCRLESARDDSMTKLLVGMGSYNHRALIVKSMQQAGFSALQGTAPEGWMEEELSEWIQELQI